MKKNRLRLWATLLSVLMLPCISSLAQDFNNYRPLRSSGEVPQKFLTTSTEKYENEVKQLSRKEKYRVKRTKKEFYLHTSFVIDDMLLSGKVLFNDPVGVYVNKVVDEILKDDKDLRGKLEVYVIKTNQVNAFTTNNGIIFVTLGLVAQVENEAELAYILCHEITHYTKQHVINEYVENSNISSGRGSYRGTSLDDKLLARSNYSKKQESEADLVGLERFLKTDYDASTLKGVFDVLQYSHLPFDEVPYKKSFLETENLKFPKNYFLKHTKEIEATGIDDSLATHPSVILRKNAVMEKLKDLDFKGKKKYIIGEKDFLNAQKLCRYEMSNIFLHYREYEAAIYNTYLLLQDDPNSMYLKKCMGKALYGLSKYANADRYDEAHEGYGDVQGSSQQVYYFFDKIKAGELNVLAVEYMYTLKKQYPDDKEIAAITEDIFSELPKYYDDKSFFLAEKRPLNLDSAAATDTLTDDDNVKAPKSESDDNGDESSADDDNGKTTKKNKYEKISKYTKKKEEDKEKKDKSYFIKYAFADLMKDPAFVKDYDAAIDTYNKRKKEEEYQETREYKRAKEKKERRERRRGVSLGLPKVVIVNPFYYKVDDTRYNSEIKLVASENAQKDLNGQIKTNADLAGLNYKLIDKKNLNASAVETFNDLAVLNYYMLESNKHDDMHFVNYMTDDIQAIVAKYGTPYFNWAGVVNYKKTNPYALYNVCMLIVPVTAPIALYNTFKGNYDTYFYSEVVNLQTGETVHNYVQDLNYKDRQDVMNSILYDLYNQYKKSDR